SRPLFRTVIELDGLSFAAGPDCFTPLISNGFLRCGRCKHRDYSERGKLHVPADVFSVLYSVVQGFQKEYQSDARHQTYGKSERYHQRSLWTDWFLRYARTFDDSQIVMLLRNLGFRLIGLLQEVGIKRPRRLGILV